MAVAVPLELVLVAMVVLPGELQVDMVLAAMELLYQLLVVIVQDLVMAVMEFLVQVAMLVPVVEAGTVAVELILIALVMMIVAEVVVQVLLGTHKLSNMYQAAILFLMII